MRSTIPARSQLTCVKAAPPGDTASVRGIARNSTTETAERSAVWWKVSSQFPRRCRYMSDCYQQFALHARLTLVCSQSLAHCSQFDSHYLGNQIGSNVFIGNMPQCLDS